MLSPEEKAAFARGMERGVRLTVGPVAVLSGVSALACGLVLPFPVGPGVGAAWAVVAVAAAWIAIPRIRKT